MIINETHLRSLIRKKLLSEITDFGSSTRELKTAKELDCPFMQEIPAKFAELMGSASASEFADKLSKQFPKLGADLGGLGIGKHAGKINRRGLDPRDIGAITNSTNSAQTLFAYFNSYLYASGATCLQFYMQSRLLDLLIVMSGGSPKKNSGKSENTIVDFGPAIVEKSLSLNSNSSGFVNNLAFYVFPKLSSEGPNSENIGYLNLDLEDYKKKIDSIKNISTTNMKNCFDDITRILDVRDTITIKQITDSVESIDNSDISEKFKNDAINDLLEAFKKAIKNYAEVRKNNVDFESSLTYFITNYIN